MKKVIFIVLSIAVWCSAGRQEKVIVSSEYFIPNFTANWFKAIEYCNYLGLRLVIIDNKDVQSEVVESIKTSEKFNKKSMSLWIGASDLAQESIFHWHATGRRVQYTKWKNANPDKSNGNEHCLALNFTPGDGFHKRLPNHIRAHVDKRSSAWNVRDCTEANYFICENIDYDNYIVL